MQILHPEIAARTYDIPHSKRTAVCVDTLVWGISGIRARGGQRGSPPCRNETHLHGGRSPLLIIIRGMEVFRMNAKSLVWSNGGLGDSLLRKISRAFHRSILELVGAPFGPLSVLAKSSNDLTRPIYADGSSSWSGSRIVRWDLGPDTGHPVAYSET
jgi:hypothetical protein